MLRWLIEHHGVPIIIIGGLIVMLIRSVVRGVQRWEIIPDPLLPERWRRVVNRVEEKALEASADPKTLDRIANAMTSGSDSADRFKAGDRFGAGGSSKR